MSSMAETSDLTCDCNDLPSIEQANPKVKAKRKTNEGKAPVKTTPNNYRGVTKHKSTGRFEAHIWDKNSMSSKQKKKGRQVYLGAHKDEEAAARTYDLAALKYYGPAAILNFPVSTYIEEYKNMQNMSKEEYLGILRRQTSGFARGVSKYRGVARHHKNGRWEARVGKKDGDSEIEAATAYDMAAVKLKGLKAITNFDIRSYIRSIPSQSSPPLPIDEPMEITEPQVPMEAQFPTPILPDYVHDSTMLDAIDENPWNFSMNPSFSPIPMNVSIDLSDTFSDIDFEDVVAQYMYSGNNSCEGIGSHDVSGKETGIDMNLAYEKLDGSEGSRNGLRGVEQGESGTFSIGNRE